LTINTNVDIVTYMRDVKIPLGQKVVQLIENSPFKSPLNFHKEIIRRYGNDAIKQRRLYWVINYRGNRRIKDEVISQIATALKLKFYELVSGTTSEPPAEGPSKAFFPYGPKSNDNAAILYNLYHGLPFKPQRIKISGRASTIEENEVIKGFQCFKLAVLEKGLVELVIKHKNGETERVDLKSSEGFNFNSGEPHYFENKSKLTSKIFVISYLKPA